MRHDERLMISVCAGVATSLIAACVLLFYGFSLLITVVATWLLSAVLVPFGAYIASSMTSGEAEKRREGAGSARIHPLMNHVPSHARIVAPDLQK